MWLKIIRGRKEGGNEYYKERLFCSLQFHLQYKNEYNIREPVTDDVTNKCRNLNNEKHHNTYYISNTGTLTNEGLHMWDTENARRKKKKLKKKCMYKISKATEFLG